MLMRLRAVCVCVNVCLQVDDDDDDALYCFKNLLYYMYRELLTRAAAINSRQKWKLVKSTDNFLFLLKLCAMCGFFLYAECFAYKVFWQASRMLAPRENESAQFRQSKNLSTRNIAVKSPHCVFQSFPTNFSA